MIEFNYTLLIQFFQLLLLLVLLNFLLFKPILRGLAKRRTTIESLAGRVDKSKQDADDLARTYEESFKEKKLPIAAKSEALLKEAHAASMKVVEEARQDLAQDLAKVKQRVGEEAHKTLEALLAESGRLGAEVAQKILKRGA